MLDFPFYPAAVFFQVFSERLCQKPLEIQADHINQITLPHILVDLVKKKLQEVCKAGPPCAC